MKQSIKNEPKHHNKTIISHMQSVNQALEHVTNYTKPQSQQRQLPALDY